MTDGCAVGIKANEERCREAVERSLALVKALALAIGHDQAAKVAKEAQRTGRTVRQVPEAWEVFTPSRLDAALDLHRMPKPRLSHD